MTHLWRFLQAKKNREILAWLGGGAVILASGLWTAVTFSSAEPSRSKPAVGCEIESNQGAAACGDQTFQAPVNIGAGQSAEQE